MNTTHYTITSDQGKTIFHVNGQEAAETYIHTLMNEGVSYSVEINKPRSDEYVRENGKIVGEYNADGTVHTYSHTVNRGAW